MRKAFRDFLVRLPDHPRFHDQDGGASGSFGIGDGLNETGKFRGIRGAFVRFTISDVGKNFLIISHSWERCFLLETLDRKIPTVNAAV